MANSCVKKLPYIQLFLGFYSALSHLIAMYIVMNGPCGNYGYSRYGTIDVLNFSAGLICGLNLMICGRINQNFDSTSRKYIKVAALSNIFSIALSIVLIYFSVYFMGQRSPYSYGLSGFLISIYCAIGIGSILQVIFLMVSK